MAYNLTIGEFCADVEPQDRFARPSAQRHESAEAPLNSSNGHSSECNPGYSAWHEFTVTAGLFPVFYAPECPCSICVDRGSSRCADSGRSHWWVGPDGVERDGLIRGAGHPGAAALLPAHLEAFLEARDRYLAQPEPRAGLDAGGTDWNLRRLDWLVWWTEWALANCEHPTFANS